MKFLVVLAFVTVAYATPEPRGGGGYSYSAPSVRYGPPAPQYGVPPHQPVVHKHIYVHVPPPEPEYLPPQNPIYLAPPQKHYKIIFIKAPTPPTSTVSVNQVQSQNEEKTLVYVLVKKPEEAPEIHIPTPAPAQANKPEVYFIRYKAQKQKGYPDSRVPDKKYGPPSPEYGAPGGY